MDTLLNHATKQADVSNWANPIPQQYTWLSQDIVFFMRENYDPIEFRKAFRKNLTSGAIAPLGNLTRFFKARGGKVNRIIMSPDMKQFLWVAADLHDSHLYCTNLTADHPVRWSLPFGNLFLWMPDSQHWAEFVWSDKTHGYTRVLVHSLQPDKPARHISLLPSSPLRHRNAGLGYSVITSKQVLLLDGGIKTSHGILTDTVYEVDLGNYGALCHQYHLSMPSGGSDAEYLIFSPLGDKVACQMWVSRGQIHRRELWVWKIDGKQGHSLGILQDTEGGTKDGQPYVMPLEDMQWCPDDKRLSFVCRNALWTVPVK
jgi:hypothetical protein